MYRFAIIFLALINFSQAALTDHLPSFLRSGQTNKQKQEVRPLSSYLPWNRTPTPTLQNLLALQEALDSINSQRKDFFSRANSKELQTLRQQIHQQDAILEQLRLQFDQRLDDIRRDFIGLRDDLKNRTNLRQQDYKYAQTQLKRQKAIIDFVSSWSKRYGILARNLIDIKNKLLEDYNEDLIKRYEASQAALLKANDDLIANWKNQITDPEIQQLAQKIKKHLIDRDTLIRTLQQKLRILSFSLEKDPLADLKRAIAQAKCPYVRDSGQATNQNMSTCFVQVLTANPPLNQPDCQAVIIPGARSKKQAIDPSRPLSDYLTCAQAVTNSKPQTARFNTNARTPIDILIDLDKNRGILESLSKDERTGMQGVSSTTRSYQEQEQQVKRAYDQYQQSLDPLRQKLSSLSDQLEIVIKLARQKLDTYIDETYIQSQENTEIVDALMEEGGADKVEKLIIGMLQKTAFDKAKELTLWMLNQIKSADILIRFDPKEIQSVLRKIMETARKDKALADQFKNSQTLSQSMIQALATLEEKYPDFNVREDILNVQDKYGMVALACKVGAGVRDFAKAPIEGTKKLAGQLCAAFQAPDLSKNTYVQQQSSASDQRNLHRQNQGLSNAALAAGQARSSLQALSHRADVATSNVMTDIKELRCPYVTGLNDLNVGSIDQCASWVLSSVPQQTKDQFPSCSSWSSAGALQCVKDLQSGRSVKPEVQLRILVDQLRNGLKTRTVLDQADTVVKTAHGQINALPEAHKQFNEELAKLADFKDTWLNKKRLKIQGLRSRQAEVQRHYETLSAKLQGIQQGWAQYVAWLSQLKDQTQVFMTLLMTSTIAHNAPQEHPNLAQDVAKLDRLIRNLQKGLEDLESMMVNFEDDSRYQRDSKLIRERFDFAKKSLFDLQTALQQSLDTADTGMAAINDAIKNLGCKWFQNIGAGNRGLSQCMSAIADRVRQLGRMLNKPGCQTFDPKSAYITSDLDRCDLTSAPSGPVNEGDVVKGGQIIAGMNPDDTDAMIHRLMEQGGYSRDQATNILKQMMLL